MNRSGPSKHRPLFHIVVLALGFIVGGFMTHFARKVLPVGPVKEFFTTAVTPQLGPLHIDLIILNLVLGPIALDVSLLSLVGVLIAYLIARSLF